MDFGKILDGWENTDFRDMFSRYVDKHPVINKDSDGLQGESKDGAAVREYASHRRDDRGEQRRRILQKKCDAQLDLHGKTRDEAWQALELFFDDCRSNGYEKVLLIHGKGNHSNGDAVLDSLCTTFIERCPFAGMHGKSRNKDGGSGSTWVVIRDRK
ncbi:MAG: Smr/MutS family protein [Termitinemataceae bacterium]|nr:MAG: Smr/MutS family protein [Termitinemataceae bacterium]